MDAIKAILLFIGLVAMVVFFMMYDKQLKSDCRNGDRAACSEYVVHGRFY